MNKKQVTIIVIAIIVILAIITGILLYVNYFKKPLPKDTIVQNYFSGAASGKDASGKDLSIDERQKLWGQSITELIKYTNANPTDADAFDKLAGAYYNVENLDKAAETFKKVIALDPNNAIVHNNLANTLRDNKKYSEAEEHYEKSIELNPSLSAPYFNLAVMYILENKKDEAVKILEEGLSKIPEDVTLKNLLTEYKK